MNADATPQPGERSDGRLPLTQQLHAEDDNPDVPGGRRASRRRDGSRGDSQQQSPDDREHSQSAHVFRQRNNLITAEGAAAFFDGERERIAAFMGI